MPFEISLWELSLCKGKPDLFETAVTDRRHGLVQKHWAGVRTSWHKKNALEGAAQRVTNTLKTSAGNTDWYKKWYEFSSAPMPAALR